MTDRPISFSAPMVRALLSGAKTQTRRLVTRATSVLGSSTWDALDWTAPSAYSDNGGFGNVFVPMPRTQYLHVPAKDGETWHRVYPRIVAGDRLWVREAHRFEAWDEDGGVSVRYRADDAERWCKADDADEFIEAVDKTARRVGWQEIGGEWQGTEERPSLPWRPPMFTHRWASRLTLAVESVRVERLQDITEEDAKAEGVTLDVGCPCELDVDEPGPHVPLCRFNSDWDAWDDDPWRAAFSVLWDSINGERASWAANPWVWVIEFAVAT